MLILCWGKIEYPQYRIYVSRFDITGNRQNPYIIDFGSSKISFTFVHLPLTNSISSHLPPHKVDFTGIKSTLSAHLRVISEQSNTVKTPTNAINDGITQERGAWARRPHYSSRSWRCQRSQRGRRWSRRRSGGRPRDHQPREGRPDLGGWITFPLK